MPRKPGRRPSIDHAAVVKFALENPKMSYAKIAERFMSKSFYIARLCRANGVSRDNFVERRKAEREENKPIASRPLSPAMRHLAQFDSIIAARMQREDLVKEPIAMDDDTAIAAAVSRMVAAGLSHTTISRELGIGLGRVAGIIHRNRFGSL